MTNPTQDEVPAGMKPWHGGDSAPDDWDGGKVLSRGHGLQHPDRLNGGRWGRERTHPFFAEDEESCDIIAYATSTSVQGAGEAFHETAVSLNVDTPPAPASAADEAKPLREALLEARRGFFVVQSEGDGPLSRWGSRHVAKIDAALAQGASE